MSWHRCMRHSIWLSLKNFETNFAKTFCVPPILGDNLPNAILFHVLVVCDYSNCQPTITTYHMPYPFDVDLSSACWKPSAPWVIFHLLATLFEPLVPLKNACVRHVFFIHFLKHFNCLWRNFTQLDQNFHLYTLPRVHRSFLGVHSWTTGKKGGYKSWKTKNL